MIITVTLNPSIDVAYQLETFQLDGVNRVQDVRKTAGGKGLNVTRVLQQLGDPVLATGFLGGGLGQVLAQELDRQGIGHSFKEIAGETRNCVAVLHQGQQTEILEQGPEISPEEAQAFTAHFKELLAEAQWVVFSGSLPKGLPVDFYVSLLALCQEAGVGVLLDTSGASLEAVLESSVRPNLIKPNLEELSQLVGREVSLDLADLKALLAHERFAGIDWIVVSLGAAGAFAKHGDKYYRVRIPKIEVVNPVGSGDSTVAGLASGLSQGLADADVLKRGNLLGMLNAQEEATGFVNLDKAADLLEQIEVEEV
ncbi:tagatose-6-phosphate kinase [Streptococcus sp. 121]|uniref:tagatose-6-phosphate kinase n=1 Tax=Streptococcus sp. 121 TaxID=2797637 RepID=UPI0018F06C88|nr:tagatose-6-phosphate kinase [Streptococcus sp. 121]MBJ6746256.1 tagatose-6-phosphate kinase [Streptococcus sp. 121]